MPHPSAVGTLDFGGVSHRGLVRIDNEDRYVLWRMDGARVLAAVADGLGGQAAGEVAAGVVARAMEKFLPPADDQVEASLARLASLAGREIRDQTAEHPELEGMGSTLTAVYVTPARVWWVNVGDSRLYLFRRGELHQVTRDHRFVQDLIDDGVLTPGQARVHPLRNMLDQCLGCPVCTPDTGSLRPESGDLLLLSTDGLHDEVGAETLTAILGSQGDVTETLDRLVRAALDAGGRDNVTVVLVRLG